MGNPVPTTRHFKCESQSCHGHFDGSMGMTLTIIMAKPGRAGKSKRESPPLTVEMQQVDSPDARRRLRQAIELVLGIVVREREPTK